MTILINAAGLVGSAWMLGAIVEEAGNVFWAIKSAVKVNGIALSTTWSQADLPTAFRSQLDVNSTASALGAAVIGGVVSAEAIGGYSAVDWKRKARKGAVGFSIEDLVARKAISQSQADRLVAFYADDEAEVAA